MHYIILHCITLQYLITLYYITLPYLTHYITFHNLQYITLHYYITHLLYCCIDCLCYVGRKYKHNKGHNQLLFRNSERNNVGILKQSVCKHIIGCGIAMDAMKLTSVFLFSRPMPCTQSCLISVSHFIQLLHNGWCSWLSVGHMTLKGHHVIPAPSFHFQM